jgi:hypothetical protein
VLASAAWWSISSDQVREPARDSRISSSLTTLAPTSSARANLLDAAGLLLERITSSALRTDVTARRVSALSSGGAGQLAALTVQPDAAGIVVEEIGVPPPDTR